MVYTGDPDPDVPRRAMALGGAAFCSKRAPPQKLLQTVAAVADGNMVFPGMALARLFDDPLGSLTARERELLAQLGAGAGNAAIGRCMGMSANTVKVHMKNLYGKPDVRNRAQAIACDVATRDREA